MTDEFSSSNENYSAPTLEITDDMVRAGAKVLLDFDPVTDDHMRVAREILEAALALVARR